MSGQNRRASLRGWWKMLPFIALPSLAIFVEAWFQTQILTKHYEANVLLKELRAVHSATGVLRDRRHYLERMERIHERAAGLGLIEPSPGQIVAIHFEEEEEFSSSGLSVPAREPGAD